MAISLECALRVHFSGELSDGILNNYIDILSWKSIIEIIVFSAVFFTILDYGLRHIPSPQFNNDIGNKKDGLILLTWAVILVVAWLPYLLSYYPGGIYSDTFLSIYYAHGNMLTNRHPFLYNRIIRLFILLRFHFGKSVSWAMGIMLVCQMILLESEVLYFIKWTLKRKINTYIRIISTAYLIFFPLIPLYGISIWKDTPFCMAFVFLMIHYTDLYFSTRDSEIPNVKTVVLYLVGLILVSFTRNNGIYISIITVVVICIFAICNIKAKATLFCLSSITTICMILFIQGPVYDHYWISQTDPIENYAIPFQQISATIAYDGNIDEDSKAFIDNIMPIEKIKELYAPANFDTIKFDENFNSAFFNTHTAEFLKVWLKLLKDNLGIYIKAYLLQTLGYWDVFIANGAAYVQNFVWDNMYDVKQIDLFHKWFGVSFQNLVNPKHYISSAVFVWIYLIAIFFISTKLDNTIAVLFTPILSVWATVMVATPIAISLRYVSPLVFCIPFLLISWEKTSKSKLISS